MPHTSTILAAVAISAIVIIAALITSAAVLSSKISRSADYRDAVEFLAKKRSASFCNTEDRQ